MKFLKISFIVIFSFILFFSYSCGNIIDENTAEPAVIYTPRTLFDVQAEPVGANCQLMVIKFFQG